MSQARSSRHEKGDVRRAARQRTADLSTYRANDRTQGHFSEEPCPFACSPSSTRMRFACTPVGCVARNSPASFSAANRSSRMSSVRIRKTVASRTKCALRELRVVGVERSGRANDLPQARASPSRCRGARLRARSMRSPRAMKLPEPRSGTASRPAASREAPARSGVLRCHHNLGAMVTVESVGVRRIVVPMPMTHALPGWRGSN